MQTDSNQNEWQIKKHNQFVNCFTSNSMLQVEWYFVSSNTPADPSNSQKKTRIAKEKKTLKYVRSASFRELYSFYRKLLGQLWRKVQIRHFFTGWIEQLIQFAFIKKKNGGKKGMEQCELNRRQVFAWVCVKMSLLIRAELLENLIQLFWKWTMELDVRVAGGCSLLCPSIQFVDLFSWQYDSGWSVYIFKDFWFFAKWLNWT